MFPKNLVKLEGPRLIIEIMYAREDNMVQSAVYREIGFGNQAWAVPELAVKIISLFPWLEEHHMKLKICDAYRPPLAHQRMKEIIPLPGFFASRPERSQHCRGTAIDVVLCDEDGKELVYPTLVDAYDAEMAKEICRGESDNFFRHLQKARQDYAGDESNQEAIKNRNDLRALMESVGLKAISTEWWHYDLPEGLDDEKYPMIDFRPQN